MVGKEFPHVVDRKRSIGWVDGNDVFSGQIAFSFVQFLFVPEKQPSLKTAWWAKRRRRDVYFPVECCIVGFDSEINFTVLAIFRFHLCHFFVVALLTTPTPLRVGAPTEASVYTDHYATSAL